MDSQPTRTSHPDSDANNFVKPAETMAVGHDILTAIVLRSNRLLARNSPKRINRNVADTGFLERKIKDFLLNNDYNNLLLASSQLLELDPRASTAWFHTAVAVLGLEGIFANSHFSDSSVLPPQKRAHLNAALRCLHIAASCQKSKLNLAEIHSIKALARLSLGQLHGAYHELQLALRHEPDFTLALSLMKNSSMQMLHRTWISVPGGHS